MIQLSYQNVFCSLHFRCSNCNHLWIVDVWSHIQMPEIMCGRVIATFIGLLGVIFSIAPFIYLLFYTAHFSAKTFYIIVVGEYMNLIWYWTYKLIYYHMANTTSHIYVYGLVLYKTFSGTFSVLNFVACMRWLWGIIEVSHWATIYFY